MSLARHLVATDLRRAWPLLASATLVQVARLALLEQEPRLAAALSPRDAVLDAVGVVLLVSDVMLSLLVVSVVVHGDPAVDARAFWRTRPIAPQTLLVAKLTTCAGVVVLIPAALNAARLIAYGAPLSSVAASSAQLVATRGARLAAAGVLASITRATLAFLLLLVGAGMLWTLLVMIDVLVIRPLTTRSSWLAAGVLTTRSDWLGAAGVLPFPDTTGAYEATVLLLTLGLAIVAWQYVTRRTFATTLFAVAIASIAVAVHKYPVGRFGAPTAPPTPRLAEGTPRITLVDQRLEGGTEFSSAMKEPLVMVSAVMQIAGIPRGYTTMLLSVRSQLSNRRGQVLEGRGVPAFADFGGRRSGFLEPMRAAELAADPERWPTEVVIRPLLTIVPARLARPFYGDTADVAVTFDLRFTRHREVGRLAMTSGASLRTETGDLFEIAAIIRRGAQVLALTRQTRFPTFKPRSERTLTAFLANRDTGVWTRTASPMRPWIFGPSGFVLATQGSHVPLDFPWASNWLTTWELDVTPPRGVDAATWLDRHQLVVVESVYAGRILRQWSANGVFVAAVEPKP